jgi:hypothetical protein
MMEHRVANEQSYVIFLELSRSLRSNHLKWLMWPKVTRPMNTSKEGLFNYRNRFELIIRH